MNEILKIDLATLEQILEHIKFEALTFLDGLNERPTSMPEREQVQSKLDQDGVGAISAVAAFKSQFDPFIVSSSGPRYWGFVTGGATPAAIAGDWLASVYDQNTQSGKGQGDISAEIEFDTIRLLLQLFSLPGDYTGGFVTGATMSNFTCLAVARQWIGKKLGIDIAKEGIPSVIPVFSAVPHSSSVKSLALLGMGSRNFQQVKVLNGNREAIDITDLEEKIATLNGESFILISSAGTVNTVDFDDFEAISRLRKKYSFWWHIDAAFGAFAACSPTNKHLLKGWENADSITVDCHKWLNVPYENAFFLVKKEHQNLQAETFQNSNAPYLGNPLDNFNYLNFLPENSRRLKALPVWLSLKAYGAKGLQEIVETSLALARQFGNYIEHSAHFTLLAPVRLNTVCFTLKSKAHQEKVSEFLALLNQNGKVFMTPTIYNGQKGIRAAYVNWRTTATDIAIAIEEMERALLILLS